MDDDIRNRIGQKPNEPRTNFDPSEWGRELDEFTFSFLPRFITRTQPRKERYSALFRYGLATLLCSGIFILKLSFPMWLGNETPFLLGVIAVVVSTLFGGAGPGLWAVVLFALLVDFYFLAPQGLRMGPESILQMIMFLAENLLLVILIETQRRTQKELNMLNEDLEFRVVLRTQELENANLELQRSNRELDNFAHIASHDLQEPLRKIQAFSDRILARHATDLQDEGLDYLYRMQRAAERMRHLIDDLLKFSRVTTRAQPFTLVDLDSVIQDVRGDLEFQIERTKGKLEVHDLPVVDADQMQMRQLFQNLITNGLKFHKQDESPIVKVYAKMLDDNSSNTVSIVVEDNGIGFDEKYAERIFNMFERLHGRGTYEGTGVGLAICKKIVERHGGSIRVESQENVGSKFIITLPINQVTLSQTEDI